MPVSSIQKIPDNNKDKNKKRFNDIDEKNKRVFNQGVKKNSAKPYFNKFADRKGGGKPNAKKFADKAKDGGGILYTEEEAKKGSQRRIDFWSTKVPDTVEGIKRKYGHLHFKKKKS